MPDIVPEIDINHFYDIEGFLILIHWLSEAFGGDRIWNFDINPTDGTTILPYLEKGGKFQIDQLLELRGKY